MSADVVPHHPKASAALESLRDSSAPSSLHHQASAPSTPRDSSSVGALPRNHHSPRDSGPFQSPKDAQTTRYSSVSFMLPGQADSSERDPERERLSYPSLRDPATLQDRASLSQDSLVHISPRPCSDSSADSDPGASSPSPHPYGSTEMLVEAPDMSPRSPGRRRQVQLVEELEEERASVELADALSPAASEPRYSQEPVLTRFSSAWTMGQLTTRVVSTAWATASPAGREAPRQLRHGVPNLLQAGTLALSGMACLLVDDGSQSSAWASSGVALISVYGICILSMLALAVVRTLRPQLQLRHPPLFACGAHLALAVLEVQWRVDHGEQPAAAWRSACLQLTVLQVLAMRLAGTGGWSVAAAVMMAVLAAVMALQGELSAKDVVQSLLLPGGTMCAAAILFAEPQGGHTLQQRALTALREFVIGRGAGLDPVAEEVSWLAKDSAPEALLEKATELLAKLAEQPEVPVATKDALKVVATLVKRSPGWQQGSPRKCRGPSIEEAPLEVQEFIMGVLPDANSTSSHEVPLVCEGGGVPEPAPRTATCLSIDEHLTRLLHTLRYREPLGGRLGKAQRKATERLVSQQLGKWDMDMIRTAAACANQPLQLVGKAAFHPLVARLGLDSQAAQAFFLSLECRYRSTNPYHNSIHAADVLNSMVYFVNLKSTTLRDMPELDILAAYTAAASHDVGHDGKSNRFHTVAETPLAQLFNEQSCLENMHCAITFAILQIREANFLQTLVSTQWAAFRSAVVHLILDTDLAKHFPFMDTFRKEFLQGTPSMENPKHRLQLLSMVLKACDVGGSAKPFALHAQWATRINAEFYRQGDDEKQLGLAPSPFCDRAARNVADSQKGFYDFLVVPLFTDLNAHLRSRRMEHQVLEEVKKNQDFWKSYDSADFNYEQPVENVARLVERQALVRSRPNVLALEHGAGPDQLLAPRNKTPS